MRGAPRRSLVLVDFSCLGIQFANRAFIDFGRIDVAVLGLRDSVWAEDAMPEVRIRSRGFPSSEKALEKYLMMSSRFSSGIAAGFT